jgi:SPP1 gp7 family putative phage head morphogenesis protein
MSNDPGNESRRLLLEQERKKQLAVLAEFKKIQDRIALEITDLMRAIAIEQKDKGNASPGLLIRQARLRMLLDQVTTEIVKASGRLGIITADAQRQAINVAEVQAANHAELRADLAFFDSAATRELIGIAGDGQPLAKHFARIAAPVRQKMFDALFFGIAAGKPNESIAREIKQAVADGSVNAMTIVRTETNRAYREATRQFYEETPAVVGWRWVAALDLTTCPICWALHGKIFKTNTKFGTHPNCRCTMVAVFPGDAKPETGSDRFGKLTIEQQKAILGPRRLDMYYQGAELDDFVQPVNTPFGPSRRIRPIAETTFVRVPRQPGESASIRLRSNPTPPRPTPPPAISSKPSPGPERWIDPTTAEPGDPIPVFKTAIEAERYLELRYRNVKFDIQDVDTTGGFLQAQAAEISRLLDLYPETGERLKYFGTYRDPAKWKGTGANGRFSGEYAHAANNGNYIALNPRYYRDATLYRKEKERNKALGWTVSENDQSTVTHEFGHMVDNWIETTWDSKRLAIGQDRPIPFRYGHDKKYSVLFADLRDKIVRKFKPKRGELSDYGLTKGVEQWAEGFSQYWNVDASKHCEFTRAQAKLIEIARRPRFRGSEVVDAYNLPDGDPAIREAKRAINEIYSELGLKPPFPKKEL